MTQFTNLRRANSAPTESSIPDAKFTVCRANSALQFNNQPAKKPRTLEVTRETPDVLGRTVAAVAPTEDPMESLNEDRPESPQDEESDGDLKEDCLMRNGEPCKPHGDTPYKPPPDLYVSPAPYNAPKRGRTDERL